MTEVRLSELFPCYSSSWLANNSSERGSWRMGSHVGIELKFSVSYFSEGSSVTARTLAFENKEKFKPGRHGCARKQSKNL